MFNAFYGYKGISIKDITLLQKYTKTVGAKFILFGLQCFIQFINGDRLRVIFCNGTESDMLSKSLQRALHKDKSSRILVD